MRSYNQYCGLAKSLDVVGDRWTLLVVRELLIRPCRYRDLQDSLPGIASNLLAARLRHLEGTGVAVKQADGGYKLTEWGQHLAEPVHALVRWAAPMMRDMGDGEAFQSQWFAGPVEIIFGGVNSDRPPFTAEIRSSGAPVTMESAEGKIRFRPGPAPAPDLVITGPPDGIIGILSGRLDRRAAETQGVRVLGDLDTLAKLRRSDWLRGPETCTVGDADQ